MKIRHISSFFRLCYSITDDKNNYLSVVMWSTDGNVFVNGKEVDENPIVYDAILPFLPDTDIGNSWKEHIEKWIGTE